MTSFGIMLLTYGFIGHFVLNVILLIKFLTRAQSGGLALGETIHTLLCGFMLKPYRELLLKDGIQPSILDELLHRISILFAVCAIVGLAVTVVGLVRGS
jgi:hypothetical protein